MIRAAIHKHMAKNEKNMKKIVIVLMQQMLYVDECI